MRSPGDGIEIIRPYLKVPIIKILFQSSSDAYTELIEMYARDRALYPGRALHAHLIVHGLARLTHFASKLIALYTGCGYLSDARKVFDKIPTTNIRGWINLIGAYSRCGYYPEALSVFSEMQREGFRPNKFVIPSILKACGHGSDIETGVKIHTLILKHSFETDAFVISSLVDMYSKCGLVKRAKRVFDGMKEKDLVTLNAVLSGYTQSGLAKEALSLVEEMHLLGLKPNVITWNILIAGFSLKADETMVSRVFELMQVNGVEPDVVSWTSVISGFVQNFRNDVAFDCFKKMINLGLCPTPATISSLVAACASIADLKQGKEIHGYSVVIGVEDNVYVRSALVDMYAKCGFIREARTLFYKMSERNTVTWNSMIFGYANHGYCLEAIELFNLMEEERTKPDHLTFTAVLSACSHAGLIELGQNLFKLMQEKYGIRPRAEHYASLVDLLGRAGKVNEAYDIIKAMPVKPDLFVWGALLGACRTHGNMDLAEVAANHLVELEPGNAGNKLLLSSLHADAGNWGSVVKLKKAMKKRKMMNFPACSWVEAA
ncbi:hypothetical protein SLE2022_283070 [Rubroshorea leprosula]